MYSRWSPLSSFRTGSADLRGEPELVLADSAPVTAERLASFGTTESTDGTLFDALVEGVATIGPPFPEPPPTDVGGVLDTGQTSAKSTRMLEPARLSFPGVDSTNCFQGDPRELRRLRRRGSAAPTSGAAASASTSAASSASSWSAVAQWSRAATSSAQDLGRFAGSRESV
jgi:hypothetical protein